MNLMNLFNRKYFKENIKKSRGVLAFFFGVIPLINVIVLIIAINSKEIVLFNFNILSIITMIGLYFVPIVLSMSLFGFLFKKKSVDFVMSKPLSRKTIYFTNIVGGVLILTTFIMLNTLIFSLFSICFENLIIPSGLLIDYSIFWIVSYIFMFAVSSLAISLSGNFITSIVLVIIIICIYPFISLSSTYFKYNRAYNYIKCENCEIKMYSCQNSPTCLSKYEDQEYKLSYHEYPSTIYTTPIAFLPDIDQTLYNQNSIIKTFLLSIVYSLIGYFTFKHRKMENNEINFKSEFAHYFIKFITFMPLVFIAYLIIRYTDIIGIIISAVAVFIYSVVYDLITRKEIYKFIKSTIFAILSFIILLGFYNFYSYLNTTKITTVDINEITSLTVEDIESVEIKNKELIKEIINNSINNNSTYSYYTAKFKIKNKTYFVDISLTNAIYDKIQEYKLSLLDTKIKNYEYDKILLVENKYSYLNKKYKLTSELKSLIKETMKNASAENINNSKSSLTIYTYHNHEYETIQVPLLLNDDLNKYIMNYNNQEFLDIVNSSNDISMRIYSNYDSLFNWQDEYLSEYVLSKNKNNIINYIKNNNQIATDNYNPDTYIQIYGTAYYSVMIGDELAFKEEFEKYKEQLKDDPEYNRLLKSFNEEYEDEY